MQKDRRVIAAILAADVVEYSRLMAADEPGTLAALKSRRAIFDQQVTSFGGREFGSVGDSLMAEFHSAVNAVSAALAIQEHVAAANSILPRERQMMLRIGITLGDVLEEQSGVFGDTVNVAARLQALARPGGVMISGAGARPGARQGRGALHRRGHAPGQEHRGAGAHVRGAAGCAARLRRTRRGRDVRLRLTACAARRAGRCRDRRRTRSRALLARDSGAGDRPHAGRRSWSRNPRRRRPTRSPCCRS